MREALRSPHYRRRTEEHWVRQFIYYYLHFRNRAEMAEPEVNAFLTDSAVKRHVSATGYAIATVQELLGHHDVKPLEGSPCKLE
jgi:site-specific recombinase XerD